MATTLATRTHPDETQATTPHVTLTLTIPAQAVPAQAVAAQAVAAQAVAAQVVAAQVVAAQVVAAQAVAAQAGTAQAGTAQAGTAQAGTAQAGTVEATTQPVIRQQRSPDIQAVWLKYKADRTIKALRNRLVEEYLPLVKYNGERIWARLPEGVELDDLISAGVFGLMDAIDAFDLARGVKFETYCVPRIRGAMLDELRTMDWVPRLVRSKASKLGEATKTLEARYGRQATEQELSEYMGLSVQELEKMILEANAVNLISLNKKWYETDSYKDVREIDILEDKKGEDPTRRVHKNDLMRLVTKGLNRNERLIIILYYYEELTMKEIGATLDLSESRVSQMHSSIIHRLQGQLGRRRPEFAV